MAIWEAFVDAGGIMSYGPSIPDIMRRATHYVDRILKGAKPADLPAHRTTVFSSGPNLTGKTHFNSSLIEFYAKRN
jgi:putative ABC transport system substrate-binding protein